MSFSNAKLEVIKWSLMFAAMLIGFAGYYFGVRGGRAVIWMALFILTGFPAAMISLHQGHPRWLSKFLERR